MQLMGLRVQLHKIEDETRIEKDVFGVQNGSKIMVPFISNLMLT